MTSRYPMGLYLAIMGMEFCVVYVWFVWLRQSFGLGYLSLAVILSAYPVVIFLRLLLSDPHRRGIHTLVGIGVVAIIFGFAWLTRIPGQNVGSLGVNSLGLTAQIILLAISGWLGFSLAGGPRDHRHTARRFQIGVLALLIGSLLARQIFLPVIIFFALSLLTLTLSRWYQSVSASQGILQRPAWGRVLLACLIVVIPVVMLFYAMTPGVAQGIVDGFSRIGHRLDQSIIRQPQPDATERPRWQLSCDLQPPEEDVFIPEEGVPSGTPGEPRLLPTWLIWLITALVATIMVLLAIKLRRRHQADVTTNITVTREKLKLGLGHTVWSWFVLIWRWIWQKIRWLWVGYEIDSTLDDDADMATSPARRLYRGLLKWAIGRGFTRQRGQTPLELCAAISAVYPIDADTLRLVTDIYCRARYGQQIPTKAELEAAEKAWRQYLTESREKPPEEPWTEFPDGRPQADTAYPGSQNSTGRW